MECVRLAGGGAAGVRGTARDTRVTLGSGGIVITESLFKTLPDCNSQSQLNSDSYCKTRICFR